MRATARWRRAVALRRALAGVLVVLAGVLALAPAVAPTGTPVVVAARDLAPGAPLAAPDVAVAEVPVGRAPAGALTDPAAATGRRLVGGVRAGETLTDVRLLGPAATVTAAGVPDAAGVPLRLADPAIAALLGPGVRVDVVGGSDPAGAAAPSPAVLAVGAVVLAVLPAADRAGTPVVLVALPASDAARVATTSLTADVTVTLR